MNNEERQAEQVVGVPVLFDGKLVVEQHQLGAAGLVPVTPHQRAGAVIPGPDPVLLLRRHIPLRPAEAFPDDLDGPEHPAPEDAFFRHGHGRVHFNQTASS